MTHRLIPKNKDIVHTRPLVSTKVVTDSFKSGARVDFMKAEDILDFLDRFVLLFTQLLLEVGKVTFDVVNVYTFPNSEQV